MKKIVINRYYGGFDLSEEAEKLYKQKSGKECKYYDIERDDKYLIEVVEELGDKANCTYSKLKVIEIPDDVEWEIEEYDGIEWVSEKHRTWS